ncbi:SRPBCC family protein [soil metagenome]
MASSLATVAVKSLGGPGSLLTKAVDRLPNEMTNVSSPERWASLAGGIALIGCGINHRGATGLLSLLGGTFLVFRGATGHCPVSQALGFSTSDATAKNSVIAAGHGTRVDASITVMKPADEVYRFWRDFENLPRFMTHLVDVDTSTDGLSRWVAKGPFGLRVRWEAEMISDERNKLISWKSLGGSDVDTTGSVCFLELPDGRGTEVKVELKYDPPCGKVGTAVAKLFGEDPQRQVAEDLERFKNVMEEMPAVM